MAPSSTQQKVLVAQFCSLTGASERQAARVRTSSYILQRCALVHLLCCHHLPHLGGPTNDQIRCLSGPFHVQ